MLGKRTVVAILFIIIFVVNPCFARSLEDNWNDFLHYTKIGRLDLAKGYAQAVLESDPEPVKLLELSEANPAGYKVLLRITDTAADAELVELSRKILTVIETGRFVRRADPKILLQEIKRLSGTARGRLAAVTRLENAGEYAIPYMIDAMADYSRQKELPNIIWALPQIGKDAIRPLAAALQSDDVAVKAEVINALGQIGYPQALAYLKYEIEKSNSAELSKWAEKSIRQIDSGALRTDAAALFYQLAESYYYHADSLAPKEQADFANIWFWNAEQRRLARQKVDSRYFNELMAMRCCEWALKADPGFGKAIGLWLAAYCKAESTGLDMPAYFGAGHPAPRVYATTAGPEYLQQALARALDDKNADIALCTIEALAVTAGEKSLMQQVGSAQPLINALSFNDKAVKYSAAIAIASAGPRKKFAQSNLVAQNLAEALGETELSNKYVSKTYSLRSAKAMLGLSKTGNSVIDLSIAQSALIDASRYDQGKIKLIACKTLAGLNSPDAQRAIAEVALTEKNDLKVRVSAFYYLAASAKRNANLLDGKQIDAIYSLINSKEIDAKLRSSAATAFGALNLPSEKVKDLILDQARS